MKTQHWRFYQDRRDITETRNIMSFGNNEAEPAATAVAATNTHIPNLQKFRGDDEISLTLRVMQLEAKLYAIAIADKNLLCCTDTAAFGAVSDVIIWNRDVTYAELKTL